ncbi:hypothetical protein P154DRAFT_565616 [Amniculicola lignicola CBS 123094]|uniref:Uncharacterized protein n=1 Tax=Amniculicola lignicola CBS 123094 TaxID=1392246 RepID=A0A6A5W5I7_9PLEO|nr:hypothetical protein P154DRAFT_565616 [Amniculicola lignicola CBS 123094]
MANTTSPTATTESNAGRLTKPHSLRPSACKLYAAHLRDVNRQLIQSFVRSWVSSPERVRSRKSSNSGPDNNASNSSYLDTRADYVEAVSRFAPPLTSLEDLDNEIHPIFAPDRFLPRIDQKMYERISPALRLATLFITEEKVMGWYRIIANAKRVDGEQESPYFEQIKCHTEDAQVVTEALFKYLAKKTFFRLKSGPNEPKGICGSCEWVGLKWRPGDPNQAGIDVNLKQGPIKKHVKGGVAIINYTCYMHDYFSKQFENDTPTGQMYRLFHYAKTTCHELAHCLHFVLHGVQKEPRAGKQFSLSEMGYLWEETTFGMLLIKTRYCSLGCGIIGLWSTHYDIIPDSKGRLRLDTDHRHDSEYKVIPVATMHGWFLKKTWDRIRKEGKDFMKASNERLVLKNAVSPRFETMFFELFLDGQLIDKTVVMAFSDPFEGSCQAVAEAIWHACKDPAGYKIPEDSKHFKKPIKKVQNHKLGSKAAPKLSIDSFPESRQALAESIWRACRKLARSKFPGDSKHSKHSTKKVQN